MITMAHNTNKNRKKDKIYQVKKEKNNKKYTDLIHR